VEWVAKTVDEAKDEALDRLGVDESEAEFEVLEEPKAGLFGRLRSEARVRARVQPTAVRPKVERGSRRRVRKDRPEDADGAVGGTAVGGTAVGGTAGAGAGAKPGTDPPGEGLAVTPRTPGSARAPRPKRAPTPATERRTPMDDDDERSGDAGEVGEEFLQGLISAFGVPGTVSTTESDDGDTVELSVEGEEVGMLIGPRGQTLAALQELTRTVVQRKADSRRRVLVDVGGYSKARREALARFTTEIASQVVASGVVRVLEPMPPADRKVVHDTVNDIAGLSTTSEGEEPRRRVVLTPDSVAD